MHCCCWFERLWKQRKRVLKAHSFFAFEKSLKDGSVLIVGHLGVEFRSAPCVKTDFSARLKEGTHAFGYLECPTESFAKECRVIHRKHPYVGSGYAMITQRPYLML